MASTAIIDYTLSTDDLPNFTTSVEGEPSDGVHAAWVWGHLDWSWFEIVQLLIGCVGIIGNLLVILVLLSQVAYKHTMDIFIGALALADLVTSVLLIPLPTAVRMPDTFLGVAYCKWVIPEKSFYTAVTASIYTLVGITIQRFIAVIVPLHLGRLVTKRRVYIYLVAVWVFAFASVAVNLGSRVRDSRCIGSFSYTAFKIYLLFLLIIRIILPSVIMITTQIITARALHHQSIAMQHARSTGGSGEGAPGISSYVTARNRVVKLMFIVVFVCLVSMAPNNFIITVISLTGQLHLYLGSPVYLFLKLLTFINFCANPFIYAARFPRFRAAVLGMLTREGRDRNAPIFGQDESQASPQTDVNRMSKSVSTTSQDV